MKYTRNVKTRAENFCAVMRCRALATTATPKTMACSRLVFRQHFPPLFPLLRPTLLLIYVTFCICFNWLGIGSKGCCAPFAHRSQVVAHAIVTTAIKRPPRRRPADESYSNYNFRSFPLFIQKMEIRHVHDSVISRFALCRWFRPQDRSPVNDKSSEFYDSRWWHWRKRN